MSEPLKYKAEKAVSAWLAADTSSALSGWTHYQGQNPGTQTPPCVVVYSNAMQESFPNAKPKNVTLTVEIVSSIDTDQDSDGVHGEASDRATNWSNHRNAVAAIEQRLAGGEALKLFCGTANRTNRPVADFFVYDIQEDSQQSTMSGEDRMLISIIGLTLVCEAQDN